MESQTRSGEKFSVDSSTHVDNVEKLTQGDGLNDSNQPQYHNKEVRHVLRKVDMRLLPMLTLLYLLSFLDRGNIGNAKVAGMNKALGLSGHQYNLALTVFFFPYAIFEVPSNIVLKLMRPSIWIMILMVSWGTIMTLQGIVKDFHGLVATRTMLGFAESGFFPAASYLLTTWYCRFELQTRLSIFYGAAALAGAFSGLLAFAIENMDGVGGIDGWAWIFILEGIVTVIVGCTLPWTLPDSPATASFLSQDEKDFIRRRLEQDSGTKAGEVATGERFKWKFIKSALLEWKIFVAVIVFWGNTVCIYGFTYSAPTIILELGYTAAQAQLLTIPVYVVGVISTICCALYSDKHRSRWQTIVGPYSLALCGMIGLIASPRGRLPGITYAFLFCIPAGIYPPLIGIVSWVGNNLAPSWKRAVGMALLVSVGNLGGAVGSNIFIAKQAPHYWLGYGFCIGTLAAAISATFVLRMSYQRANAKRDAMDEATILATYTSEELAEMGDESPLYRYVV